MRLERLLLGFVLFVPILSSTANPLTKHTQKATYVQTSTSVTISCPGNCSVLKALFPVANIVCPATTAQSCTYYVHVETASTVNIYVGQFKFLVDGAAPTPGPTDASGFVTFSGGTNEQTQAFSYAVVAKVTNSVDNQAHKIEVDLGCTSDSFEACQVSAGAATLRVDVLQP